MYVSLLVFILSGKGIILHVFDEIYNNKLCNWTILSQVVNLLFPIKYPDNLNNN